MNRRTEHLGIAREMAAAIGAEESTIESPTSRLHREPRTGARAGMTMNEDPRCRSPFLSFEACTFVREFAVRHNLSDRETAALLLSTVGVFRKEAAHRLGCAPGTVDTYWRRILRKTGTRSQPELFAALVVFAMGEQTYHPDGPSTCRESKG